MTTSENLVCEWCGEVFERPNARGTIPKYCSDAHRQRAYERRVKERASGHNAATAFSQIEEMAKAATGMNGLPDVMAELSSAGAFSQIEEMAKAASGLRGLDAELANLVREAGAVARESNHGDDLHATTDLSRTSEELIVAAWLLTMFLLTHQALASTATAAVVELIRTYLLVARLCGQIVESSRELSGTLAILGVVGLLGSRSSGSDDR